MRLLRQDQRFEFLRQFKPVPLPLWRTDRRRRGFLERGRLRFRFPTRSTALTAMTSGLESGRSARFDLPAEFPSSRPRWFGIAEPTATPVRRRKSPIAHRKPARLSSTVSFGLSGGMESSHGDAGTSAGCRYCGANNLGQRGVIHEVAQVIKNFAARRRVVGGRSAICRAISSGFHLVPTLAAFKLGQRWRCLAFCSDHHCSSTGKLCSR